MPDLQPLDPASVLINMVAQNNRLVVELDLSKSKVAREQLMNLLKSLQTNCFVKILILDNHHLDLMLVKALASSLEINATLEKLSIQHCDLEKSTAEILRKALKKK